MKSVARKEPVALITGSTAGIGKAIAMTLTGLGYAVILNGRRPRAAIAALIDEIEKISACAYVQGDIGRPEVREMLVHAIAERFGRLDVLVNNAGVTTAGRKDMLDLGEDEMLDLLKVNLIGPFALIAAMVPFMQRHPEPAHIINISSISAYAISTNRADYCISKAGLSMLTQLYAARLAEENIAVFELRPGIIATDMTAPVKEKYDRLIEEGLLPIRRWGKPGDVARAVAGIVQEYFPYSTGEVINIDGGFHIRRF